MRTLGLWLVGVLLVASCNNGPQRGATDDTPPEEGDGGSGGVSKGGKGGSRAGGAGGRGAGGMGMGGDASGGSASGGSASGGSASGGSGSGGASGGESGMDAATDTAEPDAPGEDTAADASDDAGAPDMAEDMGGEDAGDDAVADAPTGSDAVSNGSVLMIIGKEPMTPTDTIILQHLQAKAMVVDVVPEAMTTTADADGRALVVIPASASATLGMAGTNTKFRDVAVPVLLFEPNLLGMMQMTADTANDHGALAMQTQISIVDDQSPLAAGLTGMVDVYPMAMMARLTWGVPGPAAFKVATQPANPDRFVIFGYEAGKMMIGRTAPAKRLSFFVHDNVAALTPDGQKLLDAAIDWTLQP